MPARPTQALTRIALTLLALNAIAAAQTPAAAGPVPTFEVATIRRSNPADRESHRQDVQIQAGRLQLANARLITCLQVAYNVLPAQIAGPDWLKTESFDIVAKTAEAVPEDQIRIMLQNLLADRLKRCPPTCLPWARTARKCRNP